MGNSSSILPIRRICRRSLTLKDYVPRSAVLMDTVPSKFPSSVGQECAICMSSLTTVPPAYTRERELGDRTKPLCQLDCAHVYHTVCLAEWYGSDSIPPAFVGVCPYRCHVSVTPTWKEKLTEIYKECYNLA
jgi:hypothetical protein